MKKKRSHGVYLCGRAFIVAIFFPDDTYYLSTLFSFFDELFWYVMRSLGVSFFTNSGLHLSTGPLLAY